MSHTDHAPSTDLHPTPTTPQDHPMNRLTSHLLTTIALLTIVLTIALPALELLTSPTPTNHTQTHPTSATPTAHPTPEEAPRISKADKAAAHHDGCRQTSSSDTLLARPSCRSGMPVTRDRGLAQVPDSTHDDRGPAPIPTVPPAWADHWGAAAHSPHHHSQA